MMVDDAGGNVTNRETEDFAINFVLKLERAAGREPEDLRKKQAPVDVRSESRLIEVKAFGGSARGQPVPLEQRQVDALRADPANFFLYIVENVSQARAGEAEARVLVLDGHTVQAMVERTQPSTTYWPTLRTAEYNHAPQLTLRPASRTEDSQEGEVPTDADPS